MEDLAKSAVRLVVSEQCYEEYFYKQNFFDVPCFKATLSKGLGIGIIAGSMLVKLPQIMKIMSNRSSKGINIYSVLLELFAITASFAYSFVKGFPFSAWGEGTFLSLQTASIAVLVLHYSGAPTLAAMFLVLYGAILSALLKTTPIDILWALQATNMPIVFAGKMIQAYTNYKNKSTGQLSAITLLLLFFGSLVRIFTSIQETGDSILILTYVVSSAANGIIVAQMLWYWNSDKANKKKKETKKQKEKKKE